MLKKQWIVSMQYGVIWNVFFPSVYLFVPVRLSVFLTTCLFLFVSFRNYSTCRTLTRWWLWSGVWVTAPFPAWRKLIHTSAQRSLRYNSHCKNSCLVFYTQYIHSLPCLFKVKLSSKASSHCWGSSSHSFVKRHLKIFGKLFKKKNSNKRS